MQKEIPKTYIVRIIQSNRITLPKEARQKLEAKQGDLVEIAVLRKINGGYVSGEA